MLWSRVLSNAKSVCKRNSALHTNPTCLVASANYG